MVADELADELHFLTKDSNTLNAETLESAAQGLQSIASFATQDKKVFFISQADYINSINFSRSS